MTLFGVWMRSRERKRDGETALLSSESGTKDSHHPSGLHKPIQWLKSSYCVSLLIMCVVFPSWIFYSFLFIQYALMRFAIQLTFKTAPHAVACVLLCAPTAKSHSQVLFGKISSLMLQYLQGRMKKSMKWSSLNHYMHFYKPAVLRESLNL